MNNVAVARGGRGYRGRFLTSVHRGHVARGLLLEQHAGPVPDQEHEDEDEQHDSDNSKCHRDTSDFATFKRGDTTYKVAHLKSTNADINGSDATLTIIIFNGSNESFLFSVNVPPTSMT